MKRLLTLLLTLYSLTSANAEEWRSDAHRCAITLPQTEAWTVGNASRLPAGEMIFSAANMETKQGVSVIVIPDFPTSSIASQAAITRISEIVTALGFEIKNKTPIEWLGRSFIEILGLRSKDASGELVSVTRATIIEKKAYLVTTMGRGDESRIEDERFMKVLKSFRFTDSDEKPVSNANPNIHLYRMGYITCLVVMLILMSAFVIMTLRTKRRY